MKELEPDWAKLKKRKYLLFPLNVCILFGTYKYPQYLSFFTRRYIQNGGSPNMKSLLLLATAQALLITTSIISINCFVIGINPFNTFKRLRSQWRESDDFYDNLIVSDTNVIPGLPKGTKYGDLPEDL